MPKKLEKGQRIKLSEQGANMFPQLADRTGVVIGFSYDKSCVRIIWDGQKTPGNWHTDFLTTIDR